MHYWYTSTPPIERRAPIPLAPLFMHLRSVTHRPRDKDRVVIESVPFGAGITMRVVLPTGGPVVHRFNTSRALRTSQRPRPSYAPICRFNGLPFFTISPAVRSLAAGRRITVLDHLFLVVFLLAFVGDLGSLLSLHRCEVCKRRHRHRKHPHRQRREKSEHVLSHGCKPPLKYSVSITVSPP